MEGLQLQSLSIWINVGAAVGKFGNSPCSLSSLLWIYDILRLWGAGLMMHSGKHLRLPATAPENVPLIAGISTWWQVYFLCTNCAAAFFFFVDFGQVVSFSQMIDTRFLQSGTPALYENIWWSLHPFEWYLPIWTATWKTFQALMDLLNPHGLKVCKYLTSLILYWIIWLT